MRENQFSTWFSHDEYVGVKCMRTLPCRTRKSRTRWGLWLLTVWQLAWISCRLPWLGRVGDGGSIGWLGSSAWMVVFSSTQNTTACAGGLRYSPITSAALVSKSG